MHPLDDAFVSGESERAREGRNGRSGGSSGSGGSGGRLRLSSGLLLSDESSDEDEKIPYFGNRKISRLAAVLVSPPSHALTSPEPEPEPEVEAEPETIATPKATSGDANVSAPPSALIDAALSLSFLAAVPKSRSPLLTATATATATATRTIH